MGASEEKEEEDTPCKKMKRNEDEEEGTLRGVIKGKKAAALIDNGAAHNFIDEELANWLKLETQDFKGFKVALADGFTTPCTTKIP